MVFEKKIYGEVEGITFNGQHSLAGALMISIEASLKMTVMIVSDWGVGMVSTRRVNQRLCTKEKIRGNVETSGESSTLMHQYGSI